MKTFILNFGQKNILFEEESQKVNFGQQNLTLDTNNPFFAFSPFSRYKIAQQIMESGELYLMMAATSKSVLWKQ